MDNVVTAKDKNVKKVNDLGRISRILLNISQVITIVGLVIAIALGCYFLTLSNDTVHVNAELKGKISVSESVPENMIKVDESDFHIGKEHELFKYVAKEIKNDDGSRDYDISALLKDLTGKDLKYVAWGIVLLTVVTLAILLVIIIFAKRLAKALEKCESPFEENVISKMKAFGFSLIPWAAFKLIIGNIGGLTTVMFVLAMLMFIAIFNYGAKLQKESDETL